MDRSRGLLAAHGKAIACRIGRNGITARKREGDGCTPSGLLAVVGGYRHPVRPGISPCSGRLLAVAADLGWCDEPSHPCYNRPVRRPFGSSHEFMLREDGLYDICLVLDWNLSPRQRGRGSAIFVHLTGSGGKGTEGCIAIAAADMRRLLPAMLRRRIRVHA